MRFMTSITANYLPKARILAESIKNNCSDAVFTLLVADNLPQDFNLDQEPFDQLWQIEDLALPVNNIKQWIFKHTVVELCTALKGQAILQLLEQNNQDKVIYMDPDTVAFSDFSELEARLEEYSVILTPHLTEPEKTTRGIIDNEICALQHGAYNLGFLAVKKDPQGLQFARWWRDRLMKFCFDDIPGGLFTDQKWIDLAPAYFDRIYIERNPGYNVATWNMSNRVISELSGSYYVNDYPLQFYHFSGFDSGAQEAMLKIYGSSKTAFKLREWYIGKLREAGQNELGNTPPIYGIFSNGEAITKLHRQVMRTRPDVEEHFSQADPFNVDDQPSYYHWFNNEVLNNNVFNADQKDLYIESLEQEISRLRKYLKPFILLKKIYILIFKGSSK